MVGGVLFLNNSDIQVAVLPEYRELGYMSRIHDNGIMASECYPGQKVSISEEFVATLDDFLLRKHLIDKLHIEVKNLERIYDKLHAFHEVECDKESFLKKYGR